MMFYRLKPFLFLVALAILSSCELVKNSDSVNLSVRISEIGACYYQDPVLVEKLPFIEIYNYGDEAVELSDMELRCTASHPGASGTKSRIAAKTAAVDTAAIVTERRRTRASYSSRRVGAAGSGAALRVSPASAI